MSSDIALDKETHDLLIVKGDLLVVENGDYILQNVKQALLLVFGEWFLARTRGVPYMQQIFKKGFDPAVVNNAYTRAILSVEGVKKVISLDLDLDGSSRELTASFEALTTYGVIRETIEVSL